jgi:hypothetical protein
VIRNLGGSRGEIGDWGVLKAGLLKEKWENLFPLKSVLIWNFLENLFHFLLLIKCQVIKKLYDYKSL